eukprot:jgi/Chrpa1/12203/Chrysochromulina_OHIO_Genome00014817-RA
MAQKYANGTGVFVKRSSGEESLAFVKEFNEEKLVYTLELDKAGSGKIKQCREKDIVRTLDAEGGAAEAPAEGSAFAVGARVYVKRSSGEENLAFIKEFDAEKKVYKLELDSAGSGKIK